MRWKVWIVTRFQCQLATAEGRFQVTAGAITCVTDAVLEMTAMHHSHGTRNYIGGYDKVPGSWFQYSSTGQVTRWYYAEK